MRIGAARRTAYLLCLVLWSGPALAIQPSEGTPPREGPVMVRAVPDGGTLVLEDGREVRLVGIQSPRLARKTAGLPAWPLAEEARDQLAGLALNRPVELAIGGGRLDRHGRILAQVFRMDGQWLQGRLLERGLARVLSQADNPARVDEMLALERAAREAGRGLWALDYYRVLPAAESAAAVGRFALVEGVVQSSADRRGRGYLNFGSDWREDFTVTLAPPVLRRLTREGFDLAAYEGRRLRVRGWLKSFNGPMIELTHREQIEVLDE